jgi:DNA-binding MarR family transcriptional regulator
MLNKLFGSEQKIKILSYFFSSDNKGFLSKEISRSLEQKGPTVKRDLNALVDLGILKMQSSENDQKDLIKNEEVKEEDVLKSHRKNEDKYNLKKEKSRIKKDKFEEKYYLNTQNLLYPELKSLFEKIKFLANQEIFDKMNKLLNLFIEETKK